jgi:uncharacterized membrane protein (UPF0127 family)
MKQVRVVNRTRDACLAERADLADSFWTRFIGLMGKPPLLPGGGLVLRPGGAVHNFFVRQAIDVLHLEPGGRVTHVVESLRPWRVGPLFVGGAATVELPPGTARASGTRPGDIVAIEPLA